MLKIKTSNPYCARHKLPNMLEKENNLIETKEKKR